MQNFKIIKNVDLDEPTLNSICEIKSVYWQYPITSQKKWINENLKDDDLHMLLFDHDRLSGYMNLVRIRGNINGKDYEMLGIGNVCSRVSGNGYGRQLMQFVKDYLLQGNITGLLFCQPKLVKFYDRFQCKLIPGEKLSLPNLGHHEFEVMIFNSPEEIEKLIYSDRLF